MKILLLGDTESPFLWDHYDDKRFQDLDFILSTGDLNAKYLTFLKTMMYVSLLYVPGNHDNRFEIEPPEGCDSIDGKLLKYNGIRIFGLGGSMRYKPGPYQYSEWQMNWRIKKLTPKIWFNKGFDILVTHAPAKGLGDGHDLCHNGFQCFIKLIEKYKPKYFIHGHQHLNYNAGQRIRQYKDTTIINAYQYHILEY